MLTTRKLSTRRRVRPRKLKPETEEKPPRRCKNCDTPFDQVRDWQEFCSPNCKKEFWRHGGISIRRILPTILKEVDNRLAPLLERIRDLEQRLSLEKFLGPL